MARLPGVRLAAVAALSAAGLANCHWTPPNTVGATAVIAVGGGQAVRGSIAAPGSTSAATAIVTPINATIYAGVVDKVLNGVVASNNGPDANMVGIGVAGDVAYWQVPALEPDISSPAHSTTPLAYRSRAKSGRARSSIPAGPAMGLTPFPSRYGPSTARATSGRLPSSR